VTVPAVQLRNVEKRYGRSAKAALRGVSLRVERGECYGLAGPNGAGKTTLIRILLGQIAPGAGDARILGQPPEDPEVRHAVGFVPEAAELPVAASPRTLMRRFARLRGLPPRSAESRGLQLLERLGMTEILDRPVQRLSKGERQRTLLALALLPRPALLVLDEPTDGLDPIGRGLVRQVILEECEAGSTVFLNSHLLAETERICKRVGILNGGKLVREERIDGRAREERGKTAIVLAEALEEPIPGLDAVVREGHPTVTVEHQDLGELNFAIDRLRAAGAQLVEVRRIRADLEATFTAAVHGTGGPQAAADTGPLVEAPPISTTRLRGLVATGRVAREIAADLAARKIGWLAIAIAFGIFGLLFVSLRHEFAQGAAALARSLGSPGSTFEAHQIAAIVGRWTAGIVFWTLLTFTLGTSALFAPSLLDPRRTVLLLAQPLSRGDLAAGIHAANCALVLAVSLFAAALLFVALRVLGIAVPFSLLLMPVPIAVAFAALFAAVLAVLHVWRNAVFGITVAVALVVGSVWLGTTEGARLGGGTPLESAAYGIFPRIMALSEEAMRLGAGEHPTLVPYASTLATVAALLLLALVAAHRSER